MKNFEQFIVSDPQQVIGGKRKHTQIDGGDNLEEREDDGMTLVSGSSMNVIDIAWKDNMIGRG